MKIVTNLKLYYKKLLAVLSAGVMFVSGLPAFAEENVDENVNTNETSITMMSDVEEVKEDIEEEPVQLSYDEYVNGLDYLRNLYKAQLNKKKEISALFSEVYYCGNYKYFSDIRDNLIKDGYIVNGSATKAVQNINVFLYDMVLENDKIMSKQKKTTNTDNLFDVSTIIIDEKTKELAHQAFEKFVEVYNLATMYCDEFKEFVSILDELKERDYIVSYYFYYLSMGQLLKHCVLKSFPKSQVSKEFKYVGSNQLSFNISFDTYVKLYYEGGPENEFEEYVFLLSQYDSYDTSGVEEHYNKMMDEINGEVLQNGK